MILDTKPEYDQSNLNCPIIVAAPTPRCGITLLQRAINSSKNALIFGENFNLIETFPNMIKLMQIDFKDKVKVTNALRLDIAAGDYNKDMSGLYPDYTELLNLMQRSMIGIMKHYADAAKDLNRHYWGLKNPVRNLDGFLHFARLVPAGTYVFIYRDISEVVRSAMARFPENFGHLQDFAAFGARWARHYTALRSIKGVGVLHIEHAAISDDPGAWTARLEAHCRIGPIDRRVFDSKINVNPIRDSLSPKETDLNYREPSSLSAEQHAAVMSTAGDVAKQYGYRVD